MKHRLSAAILALALSCSFASAETALSPEAKLELMKAPASGEKVIGIDDAKVTIVEYASLTCPHCADFHEKVLPQIKAKYLDTGKAKLYFRGFALNPLDTAAQMLTLCTPSEKYFPLQDAFFSTQKSWTTASDPVAALLQVSKQAGFTKETFEACLRNQKLLDEINASRDNGEKAFGITGTPTFFVNGVKLEGAPTVESLSKLIDAQAKS